MPMGPENEQEEEGEQLLGQNRNERKRKEGHPGLPNLATEARGENGSFNQGVSFPFPRSLPPQKVKQSFSFV